MNDATPSDRSKTFDDLYKQRAAEGREDDPLGTARYEKAIGLADLVEGHRVLDIGCRRCPLLAIGQRRGGPRLDYTGVDIAAQNVEEGRVRWPDATFVQADITDGTDFGDGAFDRVFAMEVMEHVSSPFHMLREVHRVLADDGRLILSVPNPYYWKEWLNEIRRAPDTEGHIYAWADNNLHKLFELTGFEVEERVGTYIEVPLRLRGAWRDNKLWLMRNPPALFARSRVYRCRKV